MMGAVNRARAVLTALLVASALSLVGCSGDDPEPKFAPPSSEPPESPSTTAAAAPEESFVRSYFDAIGHATQSGDTSKFMQLSAQGCDNCSILASNIEGGYADGGRVEGASWTVEDIVEAGETHGGTIWNVDVRTARERWYDADGDLKKIVKPSVQKFAVLVASDGGH